MQLHRLEVEGFGPFRERQVVDFDAFADDGIFLIGGRTGAGKSSILDAICFGLYGGVPRYDGGEKRLRSDHCEPDDPTSVSVEFSTVAGRFRVTRSPAYERPAKRGGGMTTQAPSATLDELTDAGWAGRAARVVDVANELDEILQLSQEQFLQVILLAQNRFADFLLADSRERQALLRRLFGTERFSDYQQRFDERRRIAEQGLSGRRATVDARLAEAERLAEESALWGDDADAAPEAAEARLERLRRAVTRAEYRVERFGAERAVAEQRQHEADAALAALAEQRQAQTERDRARTALAALEDQAEAIRADGTRRDRARAAESLRAVIAAVQRAEAAWERARTAEAEALTAALEAGVPVSPDGGTPIDDGPQGDRSVPDAAALRAWASDRTRESGEWQRALELEVQSGQRETEFADAERAVETAMAALAAVEAERDRLPGELAELTAEFDAARRSADRLEGLELAVAHARQRRDGAADVARLLAEMADAARAETTAGGTHAEAQAALTQLRRRRDAGWAGELAEALVAGEPCAVCGSTEHPSPAEHADPVSVDDIAAAEQTRDAAARAERAASQVLAELTADHAAAAERAGGRDVAQADDELAAAQAAHEAAVSASQRAAELEGLLQQLRQREGDLEARRAAASDALHAARTALTLCEQRRTEAAQTIHAARGDHATVADRLHEITRAIASASAAADAVDDRADRHRAVTDATSERDSALGDSVFDDVTEAQAALLSPDEVAALDERITDHSAQLKKERALLLDLELRALPEEPIDLAPAEQAAAQARADWLAAVEADTRSQTVRGALSATVEAAASEHAATAADAGEFEVIRGLADALAGRAGNTHKMALETFVLAAELEEIVAAANLRLRDMSDGRYELRHSDALAARGAASGLGIVVFDAFTGQTRPARSLSGGETFLSSLALALGLAEVVTARAGGVRLDTLFIDEGFGSLDVDTLETAMRTLDELRQGGRTVGVISHVETMQEQIPAQLTVRALPDGPSVIDAPRTTTG